jgi:hypothetical protein
VSCADRPLNPLPQKDFGGVRKELNMLWTIFVILLVLWGLGLMTGYTMGGVIHALLVIAIVVVLVRVIQGRRRS